MTAKPVRFPVPVPDLALGDLSWDAPAQMLDRPWWRASEQMWDEVWDEVSEHITKEE